jgi:hypothetical protein
VADILGIPSTGDLEKFSEKTQKFSEKLTG